MKWIILYIALATLTANSFAQGGHFVSSYDANAPFYMSLKVIAATINGSVLEAGDEIAVFDGTICCNKVILNGPIINTDINSYKELSASKAYETNPLGYTQGHAITYKIWDASNSLEISGITAQYIDPANGFPITAPTFTDDASAFVKLSVTVAINQAPVANAGPDQTIKEGTAVTLDGSSSSDPESKPLTYAWSAPGGITLSSSTQAKPTFTAPEVTANTNYTFSLIVNDGTTNSTTDQVVVTVQDCTPAAPTVGAITQPSCAVATGSVAISGLPATGTWTLTRSPGGVTTTSSGTSSTISSLPAGTYTFTVTNVSGCISPASANVAINTQATTPTAPTVGAITQPSITQPTGSVVLNGLPATGTWILTRSPGGITTTGTGTSTTLSFLTPGIYQYTATNSSGCTSPVSANVFINGIPSANAGTDQSINEGTLVTLDGSASSDPDNNALTYRWSAPQGITLSSNTVAKPTFTAPEVMTNQNYTFSLTVNDGTTNSAIDQVFITVKQVNKAPIANAGTDQSVEKNTLYTLDGTSSSDPDGDPLTYLWTAPPGIILSSNSAASPTFTTPSSTSTTSYTFTLTVSDSKLTSLSDQVVITIKQTNQAPVAKAGNDQTVDEGGLVTLDGSMSSDPDGDALVYSWVAPSVIILSSTTAARPTFTAPEVMANQAYTFSLTVNDGTVNSAADQVTITVRQVNKAPVANAGIDQVVIEGSSVTLNGSTSYDPESSAISYSWSAPPGINLSSTTIINPKFTAPEVLADQDFVFSLIVNDGTVNSIADQVIIKVKQVNKAPLLTSAKSFFAKVGTQQDFLLEGADIDNDPINFTIENLPSFLKLTKNTNTSALLSGTFASQLVGNNTFSLTLSDGALSTRETITISVSSTDTAPYVKDSIKNISVNKGAADIIIDLKNVFADNDQGDILNFSVTSNTNGQVVAAKITGTELTLSFSTQYNGLSQIIITASSNGKEAQSKFNVEVKISTGNGLPDEDTGLLVYPNPTEGEIHLKIDRIHKDGIWISVYNESGKLITRSLIRNNEENLNLKGNVPGIYFIQIDQKNKKAYKVVLK